jgi:NADPH:quinone reductase-like Zn-dependent oxidoreductase
MRAILSRGPGKPARLKVDEMPRPEPGAGELLVRVRASSANPVDLFPLTTVGYLQAGRKPSIVGTDFAGVVEAVGVGVTAFQPGDAVFGGARGAFADYVVASVDRVAPKPAGVSFGDAGTLAVAASTALQALRDHGRVERGQRVLVNGGSGGVGTFAVQVARALGAEVTAVCTTPNVDIVATAGATRVIDYTKEDFTRSGERFDLMLDVAGSRTWGECTRVLTRGGTYVGVGLAAVQHGPGGGWRAIGHILGVRVASIGGGRRVVGLFLAKLRQEDLAFLGALVESGRVKPVIEETYDLAGAPEALAHLDAGHTRGKLAIEVSR